MNILSLFDGISTGYLALKNIGIKIDNYYSSEIDKYANAVSEYNFPEIIRLGDINNWQKWNIEWDKIDLILAGSPCQGFSSSGKGLNFEDPRSKLFFEFTEILNYTKSKNPKVLFLLENVKMKKEWQNIITNYVKAEPIEINSALVSAQSRKRLYWTNIKNIIQPVDKKILLKDIIENGFVDREKSLTLDAHYYHCVLQDYIIKKRRQIIFLNSQKTEFRKLIPVECERLQTLPDDFTLYGKFYDKIKIISNTQRYKMLGNGWTLKVIEHILKNIKEEQKNG